MAEDSGSGAAVATPAAQPASMVVPDGPITLAEKTDIVDSRGSLFGDEGAGLTVEALTGEDTGADDAGAKQPVTPPPAAKPGDAATPVIAGQKTPEQVAADEAAAAAEEAGKDPVVRATEGIRRELVEERHKTRAVTGQLETAIATINDLRAQLEARASGTADADDPLAPFKDFKELSDEEYKELVQSDYAEAQLYIKSLADYREAKRQSADQEKARQTAAGFTQRQVATLINTNRAAMEKEVPGLYDPKSDVNERLQKFAEDNGMDVDFLVALTDPGTQFIERGAKAGKYAGAGAVAALRFVNNMMNKEAEIRARVTEEVTRELVTKFNIDAGVAFKSLGDSPAARTQVDDTGGFIGEDDFRNMSEEDKRKALGG